MKFYELTELKEMLDDAGIKYREDRQNDGIWLFIDGLMQIENPTTKDKKKFWPQVRVSFHEGDYGYDVKVLGIIYDNMDLKDIAVFIRTYVLDELAL